MVDTQTKETKENSNEEEEIVKNLDSMLSKLSDEKQDMDKETDEIFKNLVENLDYNDNKQIKEKSDKIKENLLKGYKHKDFVKLDFENKYNNKKIYVANIIKTTSLEKRIFHILSSVSTTYTNNFKQHLKTKYGNINFDLLDKVVKNETKRLENSLSKFDSIQSKTATLRDHIQELSGIYREKFTESSILQDSYNKRIKDIQKELDKKQKEIDLAYTNKKYERLVGALEKDKNQLINERDSTYDKINQVVDKLKEMRNNIHRNEFREEKIKQIYHDTVNRKSALRNVYNALKNASGEKEIGEELANIDESGFSSEELLIKSAAFCKTLENYTNTLYESIGNMRSNTDKIMGEFYKNNLQLKEDGIRNSIDLERKNNEGYKIRESMKKEEYQRIRRV